MPPRVPKRCPKWVPLLFDYMSRHCTDDEAMGFYDAISAQAEAQWEGFSAAHAPAEPAAKKRADPSKSLKSTLKRFNDAVESAPRRNRRKLVEDFSSEIQQLTPVLRDALSEAVSSEGSPAATPSATNDAPIMDYVANDSLGDADDANAVDTVVAYPQRIAVRRPRRRPMVERSEQLYDAIRSEAATVGIDDDHPLVTSVQQLYGLTRELIDVSCEDGDGVGGDAE